MAIKETVAKSGLFVQLPIGDLIDRTGEVHLWRSVLDRQLVDAMSIRKMYREPALEFFFNDYDSLEDVCYLAALDVKWVVDTVNKVLKLSEKQDNDKASKKQAKTKKQIGAAPSGS